MALFFPGHTICPLCSKVIGTGERVFATPAFMPVNDPLFALSDAAMHRDCFLGWALRPVFVARFNVLAARAGTPHRLTDSGEYVDRGDVAGGWRGSTE